MFLWSEMKSTKQYDIMIFTDYIDIVYDMIELSNSCDI